MNDPYITAYSSLEARMKIVDVITNNLANSQTTGFKRDFGHVMQTAEGFDVGTAIDLTPGGVRYTRNGSFSLNASGELVTKDGMKVLSSSGSPITVGEGNVAIQDGGIVTVEGNEVATLKIVTFKNDHDLMKEGFYRLIWKGDADGVQDVPEPKVKSGALERSNVNAMEEMVHLMVAFRDFEAVEKTLKTLTSDMNNKLVQELGKLS